VKYLPLLLLALIWEGVVQLGLISRDVLPSLSDVASAGWKLAKEGDFWTNGAASRRSWGRWSKRSIRCRSRR
jgi:ABC-type nitrate/sulfonate/bicarbonate transport system permease component